MSDSRFYGHEDRRKTQPAPKVHTNDVIGRIYSETGASEMLPIEHTSLESSAFRSAWSGMDPHDKGTLSESRERLINNVSAFGKYTFGEVAANQVLARLGIFLAEAERRGLQW